jgi:NDP-sugar pyrophosphorylase family protein
MKAIVLCAGLGTRLGDLTREIPKPMLPINGQPLLAFTLQYLASYGFTEVAINLHFQPNQITDYFGDGSHYGLALHYSFESQLLGTAGAVKKLEPWLDDVEDFLVLYGDILTDQDLSLLWDMHTQKGGLAALLLHERPHSNSLVEMDSDNRITAFIERPTEEIQTAKPYPWVYSGIHVIHNRVLDFMSPDQALDFPRDIFIPLLNSEEFYGLPLSGYRCAIDSPDRFAEAETAVREGRYQPKFLAQAGKKHEGK